MSDYFWKPMRMVCKDDAIVRTVRVKCHNFDGSFAADTFFSVPANTRVKGKYVHGFVSSHEDGLYFCSHNTCKDRFK